jgi:hypothetical protein
VRPAPAPRRRSRSRRPGAAAPARGAAGRSSTPSPRHDAGQSLEIRASSSPAGSPTPRWSSAPPPGGGGGARTTTTRSPARSPLGT